MLRAGTLVGSWTVVEPIGSQLGLLSRTHPVFALASRTMIREGPGHNGSFYVVWGRIGTHVATTPEAFGTDALSVVTDTVGPAPPA